MPRPKKAAPTPDRRQRGRGSVAFDARRQQYRARLPRARDGTRPGEYFTTRADAEAWIIFQLARDDDSFDPARPFGDYLNHWYRLQSPRWTPLTRRRYLYELAALASIADIPLQRLRTDHIQSVITALLERGLTQRHAYNVARLAYRALARAVSWKILTENVASEVDFPEPEQRTPLAWDQGEARRVLRAIVDHRFEAAFLLMICGGLRIGEVLAVRWDDFDWVEQIVTIERAEWTLARREIGLPKRGKARIVELPAWVTRRLKVLRDRATVLSPYVLGKPDGARWSGPTLRKAWDAIILEAKVRRLVPHGGRHTFATGHMVAGTDLADLAAMMGHANPSITATTYLSTSRRRRREAAERLGGLFSEPDGDNGAQDGAQTP